MSGLRILAVIVIIAGIMGMAYGGFSYTSKAHHANIGPIALDVKKGRNTVNIPMWTGIAAIAVGVLLLLI